MKRCAIALAFILSLLSIAAAGFNGCGKKGTLTSIVVTPVDPVIAKGATSQLAATAYFSNGTFLTPWSQVTWQSSDPAVATVNITGLVTAVETGTAVITAIDRGHPSITGSVTVWIPELTSISVTTSNPSITVGTVQQFTAEGTYSPTPPGTALTNLTTLVSWASSSNDIAVISNATGSIGMATAISPGTVTITATSTTVSAITGTATLVVVP